MTTQEIIDNNRKIAIFMGNYQKLSNDPEFGKFHISWDWLMPVVEKINGLPESYEYEEFLQLRDDLVSGHIETVYKDVVACLDWYNTQKT